MPWDVAAGIIKHGDWDTLKALSLVCRDFESEAGRYLWRTLNIHTLGQSYEEARQHVELKLGIVRKRVRDIREVSLGMYSGYCFYWRSGQDIPVVVSELFSLLSTARLTQLSVNLDTYGAALAPCLRDFRLPSTLKQLTFCNGIQPNLGFLRPCLQNLESLTLRTSSSVVNNVLEPLMDGSALPQLRHLEVDRAGQLSSLRNCVLPALEELSVVALCRDGLHNALLDFLLSQSPSNRRACHPTQPPHSAPLRHLSLRVTHKADARPSPSMLYEGLFLRPSIVASGVLAHIQTLTVAHELFSAEHVQTAALSELFHSLRELCQLTWDVVLDSMYHRERVDIGSDVLRKAFRLDKVSGQTRMREITIRAMLWHGIPPTSSWVRRYVGFGPSTSAEQSWTVVDETRS